MTELRALPSPLCRRLALCQAAYYSATGLWSLLGVRSFQRVTGPKTDLWLVKTVGVLVLAIGGVFAAAAARERESPDAPLLAVGSALGLAAIDVTYVARRVISPVYLLDAVGELGFAAAWGYCVWSDGGWSERGAASCSARVLGLDD